MKRTFSFLLLFVLLVPLFSCGEKEEIRRVYSYQDRGYDTFEATLEFADEIVIATYEGVDEYETYRELFFTVTDVIKGWEEEEIVVINQFSHVGCGNESISLSYDSDSLTFQEGKSYLLVLQEYQRLYVDSSDYALLSNIYFPLDDLSKSTMYDQPLLSHTTGLTAMPQTKEELVSYVSATQRSTVLSDKLTTYTSSGNLSDMLAASTCVAEVTVGNLALSGTYSAVDTFNCTIDNVLSGSANATDVKIVFPRGAVEEGDQITALLDANNDTTTLYHLASPDGIVTGFKKWRLVQMLEE